MAARAEAQRAADSSALAGASAYLNFPTSAFLAVDSAKHRAKVYASANFVRDSGIDTTFVTGTALRDSTEEVVVNVIPGQRRVQVRVHRENIGLWFARFFGRTLATVAAIATAEAAEAGEAGCMKPFAIPNVNFQLPTDLGKLVTLKAPTIPVW